MKTQMQSFEDPRAKLAAKLSAFMDAVNCKENPLTREDLESLIAKNPDRYGMFAGFLKTLPSKAGAVEAAFPCRLSDVYSGDVAMAHVVAEYGGARYYITSELSFLAARERVDEYKRVYAREGLRLIILPRAGSLQIDGGPAEFAARMGAPTP